MSRQLRRAYGGGNPCAPCGALSAVSAWNGPKAECEHAFPSVANRRHPKCNDSPNKCHSSFTLLRLQVDLSKSGAATVGAPEKLFARIGSVGSGDGSTSRTGV